MIDPINSDPDESMRESIDALVADLRRKNDRFAADMAKRMVDRIAARGFKIGPGVEEAIAKSARESGEADLQRIADSIANAMAEPVAAVPAAVPNVLLH